MEVGQTVIQTGCCKRAIPLDEVGYECPTCNEGTCGATEGCEGRCACSRSGLGFLQSVAADATQKLYDLWHGVDRTMAAS